MDALPEKIKIGEKYDPAMKIIDQADADAYFELCVAHTMSFGRSHEEAEKIERSNLGYFAGYRSDETRRRVERLFKCAHPVFGAIDKVGRPTQEEVLEEGMRRGREARERHSR